MHITIIVDKSTFHSLNYKELIRLSSYYKHNITPVLCMEILGDLKKEAVEGKSPPEDRVRDFANKLLPNNTVINKHYRHLVVGDLLGHNPSLDGRPHVGIQKAVKSDSGQLGFVVEESEEEKSIYKWKDGKFREADYALSQLWRITTTQENLLENLKKALTKRHDVKFKNWEELNKFVINSIASNDTQQDLLISVIQNNAIDPEDAKTIFARWTEAGMPLIREFAPYAFHCLYVDVLFLFGLTSGLITTRPTNRVDCEYLYYLPFCNVFTSNDRVHRDLTPILLRSDQKFILGSTLKEDLKRIVEHLDNLPIEERKKFKSRPPIREDSLTFQIWKEYYDYPKNYQPPEDKTEEYYVRKAREIFEASKNPEVKTESNEEPEFIIKRSWLSKDDPCFCRSGKKVIDCCIPEKEFDRLAFEAMKKGW